MKSDLKSFQEHPNYTRGRRSIRLKGYDYTQAGGYFVTILTFQRECLFGKIFNGEMAVTSLGKIVLDCWDQIPVHFSNAQTDAFVIMPNHVHGIIFIHESKSPILVRAQHAAPLRGVAPNVKPGSLGAIVRSFKSAVTRRAGRELHTANIWHRNYFEHIIRDNEDYERIVGYIFANPANWNQDEDHPNNIVK
ncbi:MAG: transposase [Chloroflexota bacterium]